MLVHTMAEVPEAKGIGEGLPRKSGSHHRFDAQHSLPAGAHIRYLTSITFTALSLL